MPKFTHTIRRRAIYLRSRGYDVEWILEGGGSQPLVDELETNGIRVQIGEKRIQ
jgi:hypothetical protein